MADDIFYQMYEEDADAPVEQPIQLRLASKATVVSIAGKQIPIPKIEYVEALEAKIKSLETLVTKMENDMKAMRRQIGVSRDHMNHALKGIRREVDQGGRKYDDA